MSDGDASCSVRLQEGGGRRFNACGRRDGGRESPAPPGWLFYPLTYSSFLSSEKRPVRRSTNDWFWVDESSEAFWSELESSVDTPLTT